jgi:hypothetical protein
MHLQRVDIGDESRFSPIQVSIYNWGGPIVNYTIIGAGLALPPLSALGLLIACHRLGSILPILAS